MTDTYIKKNDLTFLINNVGKIGIGFINPTSQFEVLFCLPSWATLAASNSAADSSTFDLISHLHRQRQFSGKTFGPGKRTQGLIDHITKELIEVQEKPDDLSEWIDLVLLAFDGAWRHGFTPEEIAAALAAKQHKNENRTWPDWREVPSDKAIEHVKGDMK